MKYILLIYGNEAAEAAASEAERMAMYEAHMAYAAELHDRGVMAGGDPLHPTSAAATVRIRDGRTITTQGPFAETAEQLGGYYLIECASFEEAVAWAEKNPSAAYGSVEVRPLMEM
jgi:hypothetical protein